MHQARWGRQCAIDENSQSSRDREVELWWRLCYRIGKRIAHRLGWSISRVQNTTCGDELSPLSQLRRALDEARDCDHQGEVAAIVAFLVDRYEPREDPESPDLIRLSATAVETAGSALSKVLEAASDRVFTTEELDECIPRLERGALNFRNLIDALKRAADEESND